MSNATHTPEEWKTEHQQYEDGSHICVADQNGDWVADCGKSGDKDAERHAKLIAAAPDLLKALKLAANFIENVTDEDPQRQDKFFEAREAWNAAIAKATNQLTEKNRMDVKSIMENGEQMDITNQQANILLKQGLIYDSGEGYYHLKNDTTFEQIDKALQS